MTAIDRSVTHVSLYCGAGGESEEWREIPEFPGYFASSMGQIRGRRGKPMRQQKDPRTGYLQVNLLGGKVCRRAHTLVLLAFVGPCPEGYECRHLNGNQTDNRPGNLAWGTKQENGADIHRHGRLAGERHPGAKISEDQVREIRALREAEGLSAKRIARRTGMSFYTVEHVIYRTAWLHLDAEVSR